MKKSLLALLASLSLILPAAGEDKTPPPTNEELARRIEVLTRELEVLKLGDAASAAPEDETKGVFGLGPAASKVYKQKQGISIGGYGESIYQAFASTKDDNSPAGKTNEWDYLRAVLYFGWKFSPVFVLNTEIEYEHASTGKGGEVSVEFATLDALLSPKLNFRAGLVLIPVGLINELHEPPIFLGARRPDVETQIIPTTWRANGAGAFGELGPLAYKLYLTESLDGRKFTASSGLRGARQNGAKAKADDLALTGRLDLVAVPGLLAGASFFTGNSGQDLTVDGQDVDAPVTLVEIHAEYRKGQLSLRGVWAWARIGDAAQLNKVNGYTGKNSIGDRLAGWYLQAGFDVWPLLSPAKSVSLTPFVRYEDYNTQDSVPDGYVADPANDRRVITWGLDFKPIPQIVLKIDYQDYRNQATTGVNQWNVGLGYLF